MKHLTKRFRKIPLLILFLSLTFGCSNKNKDTSGTQKQEIISNPIVEGYYADPSIVVYRDTFYIYATIDPWGGEELGVLVSTDFKNWKREHISWPTKTLCTSPTSNTSMVWAPSVIRGKSGMFYMYVSVGSEVWAGISPHPLGPWKNAKSDNSPLIPHDYIEGYHMIDAEVFIDDDDTPYLYWGSGLNWINGKCFAVQLNDDMLNFEGEVKDVTPPGFFEAPIMWKKKDNYYLMYSDGKVIDTTYKVRYATGPTPFGPWEEGTSSPILKTGSDKLTISPGHHTVFNLGHQDYILYHRHSTETERNAEGLLRELCVDSLKFTPEGQIQKIVPTGISLKE